MADENSTPQNDEEVNTPATGEENTPQEQGTAAPAQNDQSQSDQSSDEDSRPEGEKQDEVGPSEGEKDQPQHEDKGLDQAGAK